MARRRNDSISSEASAGSIPCRSRCAWTENSPLLSRPSTSRPRRVAAPSTPSPVAKTSHSPSPSTKALSRRSVSSSPASPPRSSIGSGSRSGASLQPRGRTSSMACRNASSSERESSTWQGGEGGLSLCGASRTSPRSTSLFKTEKGLWEPGLGGTFHSRVPDAAVSNVTGKKDQRLIFDGRVRSG